MPSHPTPSVVTIAAVSAVRCEQRRLGFVVLESMASGVPTVCANAGGVPNLVKDKTMGEAGRQETLRWDWRAATSVLRNLQYAKAESNFIQKRSSGWSPLSAPTEWVRKLQRQMSDGVDGVFGPQPHFNMTMP